MHEKVSLPSNPAVLCLSCLSIQTQIKPQRPTAKLQALFWKELHYGMTSAVPLLPVQAVNELMFPHNPTQ